MLKTSMKNIYDTVDREIKDRFETKNPTDEQPTEYKRNGSELIDGEKIMNTHKDIIMPIISIVECQHQNQLNLKPD